MKKCFAILVSLAALPAVALWLRAADPTDDPARSAFARGNALLRDARKACALHEPDLLRQAAGQYRECLESPTNSLDAGALSVAARHNLELTKLLLAQAEPPEKANGGRDQKAGADGAKQEKKAKPDGAGNQSPSTGHKDAATKADEANAKEGTLAKPEASKDNAGWNDRPQRNETAQAQKSQPHEPHPPDSQCPT
jgi:hypothetical protein